MKPSDLLKLERRILELEKLVEQLTVFLKDAIELRQNKFIDSEEESINKLLP